MTGQPIETAVQKGVYAALSGDAALTALLPDGAGSVTAFAAPDLVMPYVLIAATTSRPADTKTYPGHETEVVLEIYSRAPGGAEARRIAATAVQAVTTTLALEDHAVVLCRAGESATRLQGDGVTYQARAVIRITSEPVEGTP